MDEIEIQEYVDPDYQNYFELVKAVIGKHPVTYGFIHRALGEHVRRDLTPIVIRDLEARGEVYVIRGYVDKFSTEQPKEESKWFGDLDHYGKKHFRGSRWITRG